MSRLTWSEIMRRHPCEWILLAETEDDDDGNMGSGRVTTLSASGAGFDYAHTLMWRDLAEVDNVCRLRTITSPRGVRNAGPSGSISRATSVANFKRSVTVEANARHRFS
jgi:hypothetical protein